MTIPEDCSRQTSLVGEVPDPHDCWDASANGFLDHIEGNTGGDGRMIRDEILHPLMHMHLGDVRGRRVFDAGCGDGILTRELQERGASVVGGDFVSSFLTRAKVVDSHTPVAMVDVTKGIPFPNDTFDAVASNLTFMWLPDIARVTNDGFRILKPGGRMVVSITHPMVNLGTFDLSNPDVPKLILGSSLKEGVWLKRINKTNGPYPYFQRPPAAYVNTFTDAGFRLALRSGYDDVFFSDAFLEKHPEYVRHKWYPLFLIFELVK